MGGEVLRLLSFVAHPDDAEVHAGGLMAIYRELGHMVKWISVTNGDAGHHQKSGEELAKIRKAEARAAAAVIGAACEVWDNHDGELMPTLDLRWRVIREIRNFKPDLVLTHRTIDYHPDHRAVGQLVQDASYMVTVPATIPDVPALRKDPVVAYMADRFTRPTRVLGDVVIDVTEKIKVIVEMLHCHQSQMYEWLPYNFCIAEPVPDSDDQRKLWLAKTIASYHSRRVAHEYRGELIDTYGQERGGSAKYAEVYEISEYASPLDKEARRRLFAFLP